DWRAGQSGLEIGAGLGTNLLAIKDVARVTAIEPARLAREHCARLGVQTHASLDDLPQDARFDYVMLRHVLEHLQEPRKMLLDAKRLLAPAGKLIVAIPIEP